MPGALPGPWGQLGTGSLLLQQLLVSPMWFPYTWAILPLVTFALPGDGLKPLWGAQDLPQAVGHPPQARIWVSSSFQPAHSQSFLEGLYPTEREGVRIAHRWELRESASFNPLPSFSSPLQILEFLWSVVCDPTFHKSFFLVEPWYEQASFPFVSFAFCSVQAASQIHSWAEVLHQDIPKQSPHSLCQVHLLPLSGISSSFHCRCLQNSSLCRQQGKK